jgi:UMF1 family MFS transporter
MENAESRPKNRLEMFSWIFYDFANTIFSMNVISLYFPLWITVNHGWEDIWVSWAHFISMGLVAISMPFLGTVSDHLRRRMPFLIALTLACVLFTTLIGLVGQSGLSIRAQVLWALFFFVLANYCYQGGLVFYNALLPQISTPGTMGKISGYGVALGYMGAIVGMVLVMPFNEGSVFGLEIPFIPGSGRGATFVPTGLLFLVCSVPTFLFLRDRTSRGATTAKLKFNESLGRIWVALGRSVQYPTVLRFLVAKFFYENAISAVVAFMAVYAVKVMGFTDNIIIPFFILSTTSAIIGSFICGFIVDRFGASKTLKGVLIGWILSLCLVVFTGDRWVFWCAGSLVGIFMGSTWTSARPLLVTLVPREMLGEFFGLYAFSGKAAAIFGPLIWGLVVKLLGTFHVLKYRFAVGSLAILAAIGLIILWGVSDDRKADFAGS